MSFVLCVGTSGQVPTKATWRPARSLREFAIRHPCVRRACGQNRAARLCTCCERLVADQRRGRSGVVTVPHLPGTHLDGGAVRSSEGYCVIGLTLRHDRLDSFWFTLMHELAHAARHLNGPTGVYLDDLDGPASKDPLEIEADTLASEWLISPPPRARHAPHDGLPQPRGRRPKRHSRALHAQPEEDGLVDRRLHDLPVGGAVRRGREAEDPAAHARQHRRTARGCGGHGRLRRRSARARSAGAASPIRRPQKSRTCALACYTACYTRRGFQRNPRRCAVEAPGVENVHILRHFGDLHKTPARRRSFREAWSVRVCES